MKKRLLAAVMAAVIAVSGMSMMTEAEVSAAENEAGAELVVEKNVKACPSELGDECWMAGIEDSRPISLISIPGTHDSASVNLMLSPIFKCQNTMIAEQLDNGYRYLDIRLALDGDKGSEELILCHNMANCKTKKGFGAKNITFESVVSDVYAFLEANPSEIVIMNIKAERGDDSVETVQGLLFEIIDQKPDMWYTQNEIPTLGDVRGKIVLGTRFDDVLGYGDSRMGLHLFWENQNNKEIVDNAFEMSDINDSQRLAVQDRFKYSKEDKYDAFVDTLENCEASENVMVINFTSTAGSGAFGFPRKYAKSINAWVMDYELSESTCYGIIVVDYATSQLAQHIYESNF